MHLFCDSSNRLANLRHAQFPAVPTGMASARSRTMSVGVPLGPRHSGGRRRPALLAQSRRNNLSRRHSEGGGCHERRSFQRRWERRRGGPTRRRWEDRAYKRDVGASTRPTRRSSRRHPGPRVWFAKRIAKGMRRQDAAIKIQALWRGYQGQRLCVDLWLFKNATIIQRCQRKQLAKRIVAHPWSRSRVSR